MKKTLFLTTALIFSGHMAMSATVAEQVVEKLKADGFEKIDVAERDGTVKVEGERVSDRLKVEAVYDTRTGEKLKEEVGRADDDGKVVSDDDGTDDNGTDDGNDGNDDNGDNGDGDGEHHGGHHGGGDGGNDGDGGEGGHGGDGGGDGGGDNN